MSQVELKTVTQDEDGMRLDRWFKVHYPSVPFGLLNKLLRKGNIRLDGKRAKSDSRIEAGQEIRIPPLETGEDAPKRVYKLTKQDISLIDDIRLFEDDHILVVNKPAGLAVQGGTKSNDRNLDLIMTAYAASLGDDVTCKLVHRLDKETSGVQIFVKSRLAAQALARQFKGKELQKTYLCLTRSVPMPHEGEIKKPLLRIKEKVIIDYDEGKPSTTLYNVLDTAGHKVAIVQAMPLTGRTHQIRVHLASLGTPILGDDKYNHNFHDESEKVMMEGFNHLFLHAYGIEITHPKSKKTMQIIAPLPKHFHDIFEFFGFDSPV